MLDHIYQNILVCCCIFVKHYQKLYAFGPRPDAVLKNLVVLKVEMRNCVRVCSFQITKCSTLIGVSIYSEYEQRGASFRSRRSGTR